MIKTVIIDDEPLARSIVNEYLSSYPDVKIMQECNDGFEGVKAVAQHKPDLIFLDIQMPKINGFEMLELIDEPPGVIFTTAFDEYAIKAFEAHAIDYLLKPINEQELGDALRQFRTQLHGKADIDHQFERLLSLMNIKKRTYKTTILVSQRDQLLPLKTERIIYSLAFAESPFNS